MNSETVIALFLLGVLVCLLAHASKLEQQNKLLRRRNRRLRHLAIVERHIVVQIAEKKIFSPNEWISLKNAISSWLKHPEDELLLPGGWRELPLVDLRMEIDDDE